MKTIKYVSFLALCLFNLQLSFGQTNTLIFDANGEFKILILSDLHLVKKFSDEVISQAKTFISEERPNLVVLLGDNVSDTNAREIVGTLGYMLGYMKTPWVSVIGNHDDEAWTSRKELIKCYSEQPLNLNSVNSDATDQNFSIGIKNRLNKLESIIYLFSSVPNVELKGTNEIYQGVILNSQVEWFRKQSAVFTKQNNNKPLNSLAFSHIALPEYCLMWRENNKTCVGEKSEEITNQAFNFGLFASMYQMGDVMGFFAAHDHKNNFIGNYSNIALGYGNFSGTNKGVYGIAASGARIVVLKENKREFDTWIRTKDHKVIFQYTYQDNRVNESGAKPTH